MRKIKKVWAFVGVILIIITAIAGLIVRNFGDFFEGFFAAGRSSVNILVLGKGGVGHEAPDLTDTIIFASVSDEKANLISLPRDIWIPEIRAKLNSTYYWGKVKNEGFEIADGSVGLITGKKVDYNVVMDFSMFKDIINSLGGIEVDVKNSFTDEKYPIPGKENDLCAGDKTYKCRYETLHFDQGKQLMDGERALKFVRSRNAQGDEGTDLAREARQQQVISAIKNKIMEPEVLLSPKKLKSLWDTSVRSLETDIDQKTLGILARKLFNSRGLVATNVIPGNLLVHPPVLRKYDRQYVFTPAAGDGNWTEINEWFDSI